MTRKRARSTSDVFADLGFAARDAEHLRIRAALLLALQERIKRRRLKQVDAARVLGITQPRVSNLLNGRLDLFSTDALIDFLGSMGVAVRFTLQPIKRSGRVG